MTKNEKEKVSVEEQKKIDAFKIEKDRIVVKIEKELTDIQAGKIKGITATLGLVDNFTRLYDMGALDDAIDNFLTDNIINYSKIDNIDFKILPKDITHNDRLRLFLNLVLIPVLKTSVDELKKNDLFKYEALRDIAEAVLASIINDFIFYDKNDNCFSTPVGNKPCQIRIRHESLVLFDKSQEAKKRYNPDDHSPFQLTFEKLKSFSHEMLTGRAERSSKEKDATVTKVNEKLVNLKEEINSNVSFNQVITKKPDGTDVKPAIVTLEKEKRKKEIEEMELLVFSIINKLAVNSEFKSIQKIALFIATHKNFMKFQKENYESALNFTDNFGGQPRLIDLKDVDLKTAEPKLIDARLRKKEKVVEEKKVVNK
tara:strand:+ start:104 stop:1213 length:1110 start_codon:yes stop_codon:yes gene_type:complete